MQQWTDFWKAICAGMTEICNKHGVYLKKKNSTCSRLMSDEVHQKDY